MQNLLNVIKYGRWNAMKSNAKSIECYQIDGMQ